MTIPTPAAGKTAKAARPLPAPLAYSVADACHVSSLGKTRIYQLIKAGVIETRKVGKRTLIPAASLHALIDNAA